MLHKLKIQIEKQTANKEERSGPPGRSIPGAMRKGGRLRPANCPGYAQEWMAGDSEYL
jgi:hypothetical protein